AGSVLASRSIASSASGASSPSVAAAASAEITGISLFGGEVTVQLVAAKVNSSAGSGGGTGDFTGTTVTGIAGSAVVGSQLGDWGTLALGTGVGQRTDDTTSRGWHGSGTALDI